MNRHVLKSYAVVKHEVSVYYVMAYSAAQADELVNTAENIDPPNSKRVESVQVWDPEDYDNRENRVPLLAYGAVQKDEVCNGI